MMTAVRPALLLAILVLGLSRLAADAPDADDGRLLQFIVGGIRSGLDRSPDNYFAALVEVSGETTCLDRESRPVCFHEATVIELYARRGNAVAKGRRVRLLGDGSVGSRALFFAVPAVPDLDVFGGTFTGAKADDAEKDRFVEALRAVGLRSDG
jgi:hypothetical protein